MLNFLPTSLFHAVNLDVRSNERGAKPLNSAKALNGNFASPRQTLSGCQNDNDQKDRYFAAVDGGLRLRKGNTEQNLGPSVSNSSANIYQDHSGSDPEQNDHSFLINSGNDKKKQSAQTDYISQILESDGYSVTPNEVSSGCFYKFSPSILYVCSSYISFVFNRM